MRARRSVRAWMAIPLALTLASRPAAAAPITLDADADAHELTRHLSALLDPSGDLTIEQVAARALRPVRELDAGIGSWPDEPRPIVWMRFEIRVPPRAALDDWYLVIGRPYDPGTVYVEQDGGYRAVPLGLDARGVSYRVRLPTTPGVRSVFLRVPRPSGRPSLLHVATATGHERLAQRLLTAQGLYLGVMLVILQINLLMGLLLRNRVHLWYVGFAATSALAFSFLTGTVSRFVAPTLPAGALFRPQMACLVMMVLSGIQFSRLFLETPRVASRYDRVMRVHLALGAAALFAVALGPDQLALRAVALAGALVPFVVLPAGVAAWRAGSRWARFYVAGWSLFTVGASLFAFPVGPSLVDPLSVFQLSSALEAALFTLALVDRMRVLQREHTRAEAALARSEQRFQSIFNGAVEATWLLDGEARILEVNDTAKRMWPVTGEGAHGVALRAVAPWSGPGRAGSLLEAALARVRGGEQARFEASFGEEPGARWCDVSAKAMSGGLVLVEARDITELKEAELRLIQSEKLAALGQLVAGVAHEVNNPNNFLTFNLPILQEYLDALRPHVEAAEQRDGGIRLYGQTVEEFFADAASLIGSMRHGAERIAGIVSQLKSYVRQNDEAHWEDADVNRVVEDAATMVRTPLRQWVRHFEVHLGEALPRVRMNPGRIEQVVINLLLNAGHAARAVPDGRVELRTRRDGGHVLIAVEDNGPGVPEDILGRIFEPFFTTKSREQGTGMGLAISHRIVDEHGGALELTRTVDHKTSFVVRLPISMEHA